MRAAATFVFTLWLIVRNATAQPAQEEIERLFRAGQQAMQERQFARAAEDFKKVVALDPALVEANVNLGLAYQGLLEYESATRYLTKALRQRPDLLGPNVIAGMDYLKLGSPEKAIPFLQHSLKLDPSNLDAHEALASAYLTLNNFREAAEQFRQVASLNSDKSEAWFALGHQYLNLAARLAFRGAHLYRESPWGHRFLGDLLLQRDRGKEAVKEYQKALGIDPQQHGLHTSLGQAYLHAGKLEDADSEFQQELKLDSTSQLALLGAANVQLAEGQPAAALVFLQRAWDVSPEFFALQRDFPSTELTRERATESSSAVKNEPESPAKHFLLAGLLSSENEAALAARQWKLFQDDFNVWQQTPNARTGVLSARIESLKARKVMTGRERLQLGEAEFQLQLYDQAAEVLAQLHGTAAENAEASYWLERTYQAQGAETYARLEESFPQAWRTHQLRAESYALRGNLKDSLKEFGLALNARPDSPELHEALGELYLEHHDKEAAQSELEKTLTIDPVRAHALYLLGRLYVENKQNEKALPYLRKAVSLQPELPEANNLLGTAYLRLGQFAQAVPNLEKAATSDQYGNVHFQLAVAYRKLGQPARADKEMTRFKTLRESNFARDQELVMGSAEIEPEQQ